MPERKNPVIECDGTVFHGPMRTLNVEVPEEVYWHVRKCAIESRLSMKQFMSMFCLDAKPFVAINESACDATGEGTSEQSLRHE